MTEPPTVSSRSAMPCRPVPVDTAVGVEPDSVVGDLEDQSAGLMGQADPGRVGVGVLRHVLQRLEHREVDGRLHVGRVPSDARRLHLDGQRGPAGLLGQRDRQAVGSEPRRIDAGREPREGVERGVGRGHELANQHRGLRRGLLVDVAHQATTSAPASVLSWARVPPPSSASIRRRASSCAPTRR